VPALALAVAAIAVPDSLNPSLIAAAAYLALSPRRVRSTAAFTVAAFAVTLSGGVAIALGLGDLILSIVPKPEPTLKYALMVAVGVAFVGGGAVLWWRRESLGSRSSPRDRDTAGGLGSAALLGASIAGFELVTAFPYFAAIAMVVGSSVSIGGKMFLLVLYNIIYVLPLVAIVVVCVVMGERAGRVLTPVADWIATHWPVIVAPLAILAGVALTAYGIVKLA
jgi:cytochrome c biogenesis protein CcdA